MRKPLMAKFVPEEIKNILHIRRIECAAIYEDESLSGRCIKACFSGQISRYLNEREFIERIGSKLLYKRVENSRNTIQIRLDMLARLQQVSRYRNGTLAANDGVVS